MIFQSFGNFFVSRTLRCYCANICDVTTVQLCIGTVHIFHIFLILHENESSLYFYRYVRAKMIVHAFMTELNQLHY